MTETTSPTGGLARIGARLFGDRSALIFHGSLLLAAAVFIVELPFFSRGGTDDLIENLFQHAYVLVWMLAVTILGRTLPLRTLAAFWFVGLFVAILAALAVGYPLGNIVGQGSDVFDTFLVPVVEELAKALPVALFFWFLVRRGWQPSMTDGLILGFLVGAGFAIHEDALYQRVYGAGINGTDLGFIFPTMGDETTIARASVVGFYHSGWGSLTGLAIGATFMLRERFRWAPVIAIAAYAVAVVDHGVGNYILSNGAAGNLGILWTLDLEGRLPLLLLGGGIVAAVVFEILALRSAARLDRVFPGIRLSTVIASLNPPSLDGLFRVQDARDYSRARRAFHYLLWARRPADPEAIRSEARRVAAFADQLALEPPALETVEAAA